MRDLGSYAIEVAPGDLRLVRECTDAEVASAAYMLVISDAPEELWQLQAAVLTLVVEERFGPRSRTANRELIEAAIANLPEDLQGQVEEAFHEAGY